MSLVSALLALMLPGAGDSGPLTLIEELPLPDTVEVQVPVAQQVRIEQRITIRIAPRRAPVPPELHLSARDRGRQPHFTERRAGKCVPVAAIGGVQVSRDNRLLLFLRDSKVISASLERACRARDFYSGFYLERHSDGKLCVDRDMLLSRSGANCKLTHLRQLVADDD